jgi:hypothetical protein
LSRFGSDQTIFGEKIIQVVLMATSMHIEDKLPPLPHRAIFKYSVNCPFNLKREASFPELIGFFL